jgi:hypothetical protein
MSSRGAAVIGALFAILVAAPAGAAPAITAAASGAAQPWQTLPPLPSLPAGTLGRHAEIDGSAAMLNFLRETR